MANHQVLFIDGGLSTQLELHHQQNLAHDLWTASLLLTPEGKAALQAAHEQFFSSGSDIVVTATYQATVEGFMKFTGKNEHEAADLMIEGIRLAMRAREHTCKPGQGRVFISIGPYGATLHDGSEYTGKYPDGIDASSLSDFHARRMELLSKSGCTVDGWALETFPSLMEAAAISRLMVAEPYRWSPCWISFQCKDDSHLADGTPMSTAADEVCKILNDRTHAENFIGVNCVHPSLVDGLLDHMLPACVRYPHITGVILYPNRGGDWDAETKAWIEGSAREGDDPVSRCIRWRQRVREAGLRLMIGGCCSTDAPFIRQLRQTLSG